MKSVDRKKIPSTTRKRTLVTFTKIAVTKVSYFIKDLWTVTVPYSLSMAQSHVFMDPNYFSELLLLTVIILKVLRPPVPYAEWRP